jgi:hypothetical protein
MENNTIHIHLESDDFQLIYFVTTYITRLAIPHVYGTLGQKEYMIQYIDCQISKG